MVESVKTLEEVLEPAAGDMVWCEADNKPYRWDPVEGWKPVAMEGNFQMSAYDMNKQIMGQLPELDAKTLAGKKEMMREFMQLNDATFYMLLCRDINYYTLFYKTPVEHELAEEFLEDIMIDECLPNIGKIKSIELTDGAIEIWVQDAEDCVYVAYFFPYDSGVIVCG